MIELSCFGVRFMAEMIDTSVKGWQKKLEECMRQNKKVLIVTKDEELANALVAGNLKGTDIRRIIFGAKGFTTGVPWLRAAAAFVIPWDRILEVVIPLLKALFRWLEVYWLESLINQLVEKNYKFVVTRKKDGEIVIEGEPATA
jgi:hypothetical protein